MPLLRIIALALALLAVSPPTRAQDAAPDLPDPSELTRTLDKFAEQLAKPGDDASITAIRDAALDLRAQARALAAARGQERDQARQLLAALGPPPPDGQSESRDITSERKRLSALIAELEGRVQRANLIGAQAEAVERRAALALRALSFERIFARGASPFDTEAWARAGEDFAEMQSGLSNEFAAVGGNLSAEGLMASPLPYLVVAGMLALFVGFGARSFLMQRLRRRFAGLDLTRSRKLVYALLAAAIRLILPLAAVFLVYAPLHEIFAGTKALALILGEVLVASVGGITAHALSAAVLAPDNPARRVLDVSDRVAAAWPRATALFAVLFVFDRAIAALADSYGQHAETLIFFNMPVVLGAAGTAAYLTLEGFEPRSPALKRLRWALLVALGVIAAAPFAGYFALARFAVIRIILSAVMAATLWLVFRLSEEAIDAIFAPAPGTAKQPQADSQLLGWWLKAAIGAAQFLIGLSGLAFIWGASASDVESFLADLAGGFNIGGVTISPVDVLVGLVLFAIGLAVVRFLQRLLETNILPRTRLDHGAQNAVRAGFGYAGVLIAALAAISSAGFDLTNLAIIAGALSVGIGFGLQTIANNFISGLILLIERPFQVGDWIVTGENEGFVRNIKVRATEIQTFDNAIVIVPNSDLVTGRVTNWTHRDISGRIIIPVGVAYGSDPEVVRRLLLEVAEEYPLVLAHPEPFVLFNSFGESSLDFELRVILRDVTKRFQARSDLHFAIEKKLRDNGIQIPFPQRDVHVKGFDKVEAALEALTKALTQPR